MVVRCPTCQSAYRLDATRMPEAGVRVRCPRCLNVFVLRPSTIPAGAGPVPPRAPGPPASPTPTPRAPARAGAAPSAPQPSFAPGRAAGPVPPTRPALPPARSQPKEPGLEGFEVDGREPPRLRPAAPQRRAESPPPAPLPKRLPAWTEDRDRTLDFGAPAPKPAPRLETAPFRPTASRPAGPVTPTAPPAPPVRSATEPRPVPAAPEHPASGASASPAPGHERARRLARVLVSDILVYNQAVRDRARAEGNLATALGPEVSKAWELYKSKVSPEVAASTSYFKDALNEILAGGEEIF